MNNGQQIGLGGFNILPKGVKNLLIINTLVFFATVVFAKTGMCDLNKWLGLHYFKAPDFQVWQFITYMFMHANFGHLFFNMFALWMFGAAVENYWGTKKFLLYYLATGIGAALTHYVITAVEIGPTMALFNQFLDAPSLTLTAISLKTTRSHNSRVPYRTTITYCSRTPALSTSW